MDVVPEKARSGYFYHLLHSPSPQLIDVLDTSFAPNREESHIAPSCYICKTTTGNYNTGTPGTSDHPRPGQSLSWGYQNQGSISISCPPSFSHLSFQWCGAQDCRARDGRVVVLRRATRSGPMS